MSEKLKFEIGADLAPLEKSLNDAGKQIKAFTDANKRNFERSGLQIASIGATIVALSQDVAGSTTAIKDFFEGLATSIESGDIPTLIGLITSGFGVLVGLIPTIVSGIALVRTAFASLTLTLTANPIGAIVAAIGLAIVGVITIFQLFSTEVDKFTSKRDLLNEVNMGAVKSLAKEKAELVSLLAIAKDIQVPYEQRLKAVKKLNEISPEYLGNIKLENIETTATTEAINKYNEAILKKAKGQAANKLLSENIEKQLAIELRSTKLITKGLTEEEEARQRAILGDTKVDAIKAQLLKTNEALTKTQTNGLEALKAEEREILKLIQAYEGYDIQLKNTKQAREELFRPKDLKAIQGMQPTGLEATPSLALFTTDGLKEFREKLSEEQIRIQNLLLDLNESINMLINDTIASTFSQLGDAIGNALATGGNVLQSVGATLLQQMGKFMSSFGDQLIRFGLSAKAFAKLQLSLGSPPATLASAGAAIAAGLLLKAAGAAVASTGGSFGGGGGTSNFSGSTATAQTSNVSGSSFSAQSGNEVVFRIAGNDLLGVLRRAENAENRIG
jgi:hypothetical protein